MKNRFKLLLAAITIMSIGLVYSLSNAQKQNTKLLFRTKVSSLGLQASSSFAKDKSKDSVVEISLPGKLYNPPIKLTEIRKEEADRNSPESAEASFYSANRKGDMKWIIDNWVQKEQNEVQNFLKKYLSQNTKISQKIDKSYLIGKAEYKIYAILLIRNVYSDGRESKIAHTYKKTNKSWKSTNALSADETYDVIFSALRSGSVLLKE